MPAPVFIGTALPISGQGHMSGSYSRRDYGYGTTPSSLRDMIVDSMFDHPTPTSFNSHFAPSSMKSDTADRMPSFETAFCQGYTCCGLELNDLHHLLEHFEETHVNDLPLDAPKSPQAAIQDLKRRARNVVLQSQVSPPTTTSAAAVIAALAASVPDASSYSSSPAAVPTPLMPTPVVTAASAIPPLDNRPRSPGLSSASSTCPSPVTPAGGSFNMDDVEMDTDEASDDNSQSLFPADRVRGKKRSYASALALGRLRGTMDSLNIGVNDSPRSATRSPSSSRTGSVVASPTMANLDDDDEESMDADDGETSSVSSLAASGGLPPSAFYPTIQNSSPPEVSAVTAEGLPVLNVPGLPENFVPPMPTLPSGRTWVPPQNKPFKCPVPGCDKSYKQQNGLKYHRLHGNCNNRAGGAVGKEAEGRETLEEKPYGCYVGPSCGKRYKNMNGLRYHYMHSGEHGQIGLAMLTAGTHPPPLFPGMPVGHARQTSSNASSRSVSPSATGRLHGQSLTAATS